MAVLAGYLKANFEDEIEGVKRAGVAVEVTSGEDDDD